MTMRRFFLQRFKKFFLMMMLPTIVFCCIFFVFINVSDVRRVAQRSENTLDHVRTNFELVMSNSTYQYELLTYNPAFMLSLQKQLSYKSYDYSDLVILKAMKTLLGTSTSSQTMIKSVYLYLDGYDSFYSSRDNIVPLSSYFDQEWYTQYTEYQDETLEWLRKRTVQEYKYAPAETIITIFNRLSNIKGVIAININEKKLSQVMEDSSSSNQEQIFFLDKNNRLLSTNTTAGKFSDTASGDLISQLSNITRNSLSGINGTWLKLDGHFYLAQVLPSSEYETSFLALVAAPDVFSNIASSFSIFLLVLMSNLLIVLLLSYVVTKQNFQHINQIIQVFDDAENGHIYTQSRNVSQDEYDVILNNIIRVFLNTNNLKQELMEKQYQQEIAELASLQLQINPHFLFNTLQSIDFEALKHTKSPTIVNTMIQDLSDILKYSLDDPTTTIPLAEELDYLKKYTQIQKHRYQDSFIMYYEIDDDLLDCHVFRLMLQPLIENSITHGIRSKQASGETGYMKLKVYLRGSRLHFAVIDSGCGMTKREISHLYQTFHNDKTKSIGLKNVNQRLVLKYGIESELHIQSKKDMGTCIYFSIPQALEPVHMK